MLPTPMPLTPRRRGDNPCVPLPFVPPPLRPDVTLAQHVADRNDPHGTLRLLRESLDGYVTGGRFVPESCRIELLHGETVLSSIDASPFVKDGMVSSVTVSGGSLVIEWNSDSGAAGPTAIPLTDIFNPSNYYTKTTADARFVAQVYGKGLSTNDYTTPEKTKLGGVEAGAKDNVVEAAGASAFPATGEAGKVYVAKDENKTYRWNGSQYVQIGGGSSVAIDPTLSEQGKAADAKATGDALAARPTKVQLDAGWWSEWTISPNDGTTVEWSGTFWYFVVDQDEWPATGGDVENEDATYLEYDGVFGDYTATRHRVAAPVPTKTSQLANDGEDGVNPFVTSGTLAGYATLGYADQKVAGAVALIGIPAFSMQATYAVGAKVVYDGAVWDCTAAVSTAGLWTGTTNWAKLFDLETGAPASGGTKLITNGQVCAALQNKADAAALRYDLVQTITLGQLQDRAVQKVTLNAASTTLVLPALTDLTGKVSDFGIDMVNAYEVSGTPTAATFQLDGTLGTDYNLIVPKGETWSDMTALAAGEIAAYYFTLSAFQIDDLPTWEVIKQVVELVPVPTAP